jgi:hypothetical protein
MKRAREMGLLKSLRSRQAIGDDRDLLRLRIHNYRQNRVLVKPFDSIFAAAKPIFPLLQGGAAW